MNKSKTVRFLDLKEDDLILVDSKEELKKVLSVLSESNKIFAHLVGGCVEETAEKAIKIAKDDGYSGRLAIRPKAQELFLSIGPRILMLVWQKVGGVAYEFSEVDFSESTLEEDEPLFIKFPKGSIIYDKDNLDEENYTKYEVMSEKRDPLLVREMKTNEFWELDNPILVEDVVVIKVNLTVEGKGAEDIHEELKARIAKAIRKTKNKYNIKY